jgi:hypothetical protein
MPVFRFLSTYHGLFILLSFFLSRIFYNCLSHSYLLCKFFEASPINFNWPYFGSKSAVMLSRFFARGLIHCLFPHWLNDTFFLSHAFFACSLITQLYVLYCHKGEFCITFKFCRQCFITCSAQIIYMCQLYL